MNIISFSLWGNNPMYNMGFIFNYGLHSRIYKDWDFVLYYDDTIDDLVKEFIEVKNIKSFNMTGSKIPGEFWRFFANDINEGGYTIFRDCDSRISEREELAVKQWIESGKGLHVMRDHPYHKIPLGVGKMGMLAGMWGIKSGLINIKEMLDDFVNDRQLVWGSDQTFIYSIYEKFNNDKLVHDPFHSNLPFPIERKNYHFVGERFDENNKRFDDYKILMR